FPGRMSVVLGGEYPGSTRRAAYSDPMCVEFFHLEPGWIGVNGLLDNGWTHQFPLLANRTICCPALPPSTRPAIISVRAAPPGAASGTSVNSIDGGVPLCAERQPPRTRQIRPETTAEMGHDPRLDASRRVLQPASFTCSFHLS